jgi:hypothetical protein
MRQSIVPRSAHASCIIGIDVNMIWKGRDAGQLDRTRVNDFFLVAVTGDAMRSRLMRSALMRTAFGKTMIQTVSMVMAVSMVKTATRCERAIKHGPNMIMRTNTHNLPTPQPAAELQNDGQQDEDTLKHSGQV